MGLAPHRKKMLISEMKTKEMDGKGCNAIKMCRLMNEKNR